MNFQHFNKLFSFLAKNSNCLFFLLISSSTLAQSKSCKLQDVGFSTKKDIYDNWGKIKLDGKTWRALGFSISCHIHYLLFGI